ncbi:unnamed protein product, partial [Iphiclides podalirius]
MMMMAKYAYHLPIIWKYRHRANIDYLTSTIRISINLSNGVSVSEIGAVMRRNVSAAPPRRRGPLGAGRVSVESESAEGCPARTRAHRTHTRRVRSTRTSPL